MGYTHYYERVGEPEDRAAYAKFAMDVKAIVAVAGEHGIDIAGPFGDGKPELTEGWISLNGRGGDAHETFRWEAAPEPGVELAGPLGGYFDFCKTARKPYDAVVTAALIAAAEHYGRAVEISSDGSWDEWAYGADLYREATGREPYCPPAVRP